jgi:hypothetical protein
MLFFRRNFVPIVLDLPLPFSLLSPVGHSGFRDRFGFGLGFCRKPRQLVSSSVSLSIYSSTHHPSTHHPSTHHPSTHHPSTHHPSTHHPFIHYLSSFASVVPAWMLMSGAAYLALFSAHSNRSTIDLGKGSEFRLASQVVGRWLDCIAVVVAGSAAVCGSTSSFILI